MRTLSLGFGFLRPSTVELSYQWFHRVVAGYCLLFGVLYWIRLIGLYEGNLWRFDLMPAHWQVAAVALAILFPVAGAGLWMVASWGPVIWFICASVEVIMYGVLPELFGFRPAVIVSHALVAVLYLVFRVVIYLQKRDAA